MADSVCGIDEAGRGPLFGNVIAGAVILNPANPIYGLADSKKLSSVKRESLYQEIVQKALAWGIGSASPEEIDSLNILQATMLAMKRALEDLMKRSSIIPSIVLIDGNRAPIIDLPTKAIIKGDSLEPVISAASILAKVTRDNEMKQYHLAYPHYGFDQHMGYPTKMHLEKIREFGIIQGYRHSFGPIKKIVTNP
jgi:ribonuclease HII